MEKRNGRTKAGEKYECVQEHGPITFEEATDNWECPHCLNKLAIRAEIGKDLHTIHRVHPDELSRWDLVAINSRAIWEVIEVLPDMRRTGFYRIALSKFGTHTADGKEYVDKVMGIWRD